MKKVRDEAEIFVSPCMFESDVKRRRVGDSFPSGSFSYAAEFSPTSVGSDSRRNSFTDSYGLEGRGFVDIGNGLGINPPWDILRGRCVFKDRSQLEKEIEDSELSHWAPNCATFSRAREIPLKNVKRPPKPVRSECHPEGIPSEIKKMSRKAVSRLKRDTEMAVLSAEQAEKAAEVGKKFTLEHPGRSIALHLPSWKRLLARDDVHVI